MTSLTGTYRLAPRERFAIQELHRRRLGQGQIAQLLGRSTSTVNSHVADSVEKGYIAENDNRRHAPLTRTRGRNAFLSGLTILRVKVKLYLRGIIDTLKEALNITPGQALAVALSEAENTPGEQQEDPA